MRKLEYERDEIVPGTRLRVVHYGAERDKWNNRLVQVRCEWPVNDDPDARMCNTLIWVRASSLKPRPNDGQNGKRRLQITSCGCQSKRAYRKHFEDRANRIGRSKQAEIYWAHIREGESFEDLARRYKLARQVISTVCRLYGQTWKKNTSQRA